MRPTRRRLSEQVVVITGASSGLGLATARRLAAAGATVVLAARGDAAHGEEALQRAVEQIRAAGGKASHVASDLSTEAGARAVAEHALARHGRFDAWVNNAGVGLWGELLDVPLEDHRRLFDLDLWSVVHGTRTAVEHLRERGGVVINVGSVLSERGMPCLGVYSAAEHAVKAFTDALRMELEKANVPVALTLIKAPSLDTPFTRHARSHLSGEPRLPGPLYDVDVVARAIERCLERPRKELTVGGLGGQVPIWAEKLAPRLVDLVARRAMRSLGTQHDAATRLGVGQRGNTLRTPTEGELEVGAVSERPVRRRSYYTEAVLHPVRTGLLVALAGAAAIGLSAALRAPAGS
jgi:NAD(P)-dependent dehydrogenase (short-subunit alcohol dehydrogenase family)